MIVDPGIKVDRGYKAYDDGIAEGLFIKVSPSACMCQSATQCNVRYTCTQIPKLRGQLEYFSASSCFIRVVEQSSI